MFYSNLCLYPARGWAETFTGEVVFAVLVPSALQSVEFVNMVQKSILGDLTSKISHALCRKRDSG